MVVNLPWQPIPESLRPARDICIITPDEFDWSLKEDTVQEEAIDLALVHVNGLLQKLLRVLRFSIDLIL